jgi:hypothetical protein
MNVEIFLLHYNILCSQLSFTANMKKKKTLFTYGDAIRPSRKTEDRWAD